MTELLRQMALPPEAASLVETIHMSGEHLLALVNDLLDTSRLDAGRLVLEDVEFLLRDVVEEAIEMAAATSCTKPLSVAGIIDPALPDVVRGDPRRLGQVLANLLGNGVKFTSTGSVCARLTRVSNEAGAVICRVEVEDSGIGIAPDVVPRLFQPFVQADEATGRRYGGTGLGLCIAAGIVSAMGARIEVDSAPGQGSRFHFDMALAPGQRSKGLVLPSCEGLRVVLATRDTLLAESIRSQVARLGARLAVTDAADAVAVLAQTAPVAVLVDPRLDGADDCRTAAACRLIPVVELVPPRRTASADVALHLRTPVRLSALASVLTTLQPHERRAGTHAAIPMPRGMWRVLVVEDNDANQQLMTRVLDSIGVGADVVTSGEDACAAVTRWAYDLILMDCRLPGMDGLATTRAIRASRGGQTIPILGVTASAVTGVRHACLDAGMNDVLMKPTRPSALVDALRRWLTTVAAPPAGVPLVPREPDAPEWLDAAVVAELERLDLFSDMVRRVTHEAPSRLMELREAERRCHLARLSTVAHGLVTLLGNVGWGEGAALASQLEVSCSDGDPGAARTLAHTLEELLVTQLPRLDRLAVGLAKEGSACAP
jgi:two-component system sensor histidine kinase/response regulator